MTGFWFSVRLFCLFLGRVWPFFLARKLKILQVCFKSGAFIHSRAGFFGVEKDLNFDAAWYLEFRCERAEY